MLREVHAIAGTHVHAKLVNPAAEAFGVTQVAKPHRFKTGQDASLGLLVGQSGEPSRKGLGLPDLIHRGSVSIRIRLVNGRFRGITLELRGGA